MSRTGGCLLTQDGDDNSYFFTGSKYLESISSIKITNNNSNNWHELTDEMAEQGVFE